MPIYSVNPNRIDQAGWAVLYGPEVTEEVEEALDPLVWHRQKQAAHLFQEIHLPANMDSLTFRTSFGFGPAVPAQLPYYLMIVGDPRTVPFELQYQLGVQYAVGRLHFDSENALDEYARYAATVRHYESAESESIRPPAIFGVEGKNYNDRFLIDGLVDPLTKYLREQATLWRGKLDGVVRVVGDRKADFGRLLDDPPGFLFAASHGLDVSNPENPDLPLRQGALVCSDSYFSGEDLGSQDLRGMVSLLFACYSAGVSEFDDFPDGGPQQIAPHPMISHLAKRMLAQGAQATIGHINRVFDTSFDWSSRTGDLTAVFTSTCHEILDGARVGHAMKWINQRYAEISTTLVDPLRKGIPNECELMARLRKANLEARNFIIVGDPAVRLPGFGKRM